MAEAFLFRCTSCGPEIQAWSGGNPYVIEDGRKRHVYHPDHNGPYEGSDDPHRCLECGAELLVDSQSDPPPTCPNCRPSRALETTDLEGIPCPKC